MRKMFGSEKTREVCDRERGPTRGRGRRACVMVDDRLRVIEAVSAHVGMEPRVSSSSRQAEDHANQRPAGALLVGLKRAYEKADERDGTRVLVDRLWPRGVSKDTARLDAWMKELAPSDELRTWFRHRTDR